MHRVIARTRSFDVPESRAKAFVPDGKRQVLGEYKVYWQQFDTEAEARALIMRSIMNIEAIDRDIMKIKLINFLYQNYYCTDDVFVTYDDTSIINKQHISYAAEERNH